MYSNSHIYEEPFASFASSWGFDEQEFRSKTKEFDDNDDVNGYQQKEVTTRFYFESKLCHNFRRLYIQLINIKNNPTLVSCLDLIGDFEEDNFHSACLYILSAFTVMCFATGKSLFLFMRTTQMLNKIVKALESNLSLYFCERRVDNDDINNNDDDDDVDSDIVHKISCKEAFQYMILLTLIHHFHEYEYQSFVLPNDNIHTEIQSFGTLGKVYDNNYMYLISLLNITFNVVGIGIHIYIHTYTHTHAHLLITHTISYILIP